MTNFAWFSAYQGTSRLNSNSDSTQADSTGKDWAESKKRAKNIHLLLIQKKTDNAAKVERDEDVIILAVKYCLGGSLLLERIKK